MRGLLKFLGIVVVGIPLVLGGLYWYVEYVQTAGPPPSVAKRVEPAHDSFVRRATFGAYAYDYSVVDEAAVATFTPLLARDDRIVVGAIRAVVSSAFGVDISQSPPVLQGREITFKTGSATYYAMVVKEDTGQVHSVRVRR